MSSIDILPSSEQKEIVEGIARVLEDAGAAKTDFSTVAELGYLGIGLSDDHGGFGLGFPEEALINVELGRSVADLRILATMLGARLASMTGDSELCGSLLVGNKVAGFVTPVYGWSEAEDGPSGNVYLIGDADLYLAISPRGGSLVEKAAFSDVEKCESMDATAPLSRAKLSSANIWRDDSKVSLWDVAMLMVVGQLIGIAEAAMMQGAEYAKTREQFDKPIGAFQGIAHPLADCALRKDAAANQFYYASIALRDGFPDASRQVTAAWLVAMDAALRNATTNIQTHGAMGYSAETGAHFFLKRAVVLRQIAGGVRLHERAMLSEAA